MIFLDIKTAGLTHDYAILDIGAVELENPSNQFYVDIRSERGKKIDPLALEYNQIDEKDIYNPERKSLGKALKSFEDWVNGVKVRSFAGHNPNFDVGFLRAAMEEKGIQRRWQFGHRLVDLYSTAISAYLSEGIKIPLDQESGRYGIDSNSIFNSVGLPKEPKPKTGIMGAKMEAEAYSRLVFGTSLFPDLEKNFPFGEIEVPKTPSHVHLG